MKVPLKCNTSYVSYNADGNTPYCIQQISLYNAMGNLCRPFMCNLQWMICLAQKIKSEQMKMATCSLTVIQSFESTCSLTVIQSFESTCSLTVIQSFEYDTGTLLSTFRKKNYNTTPEAYCHQIYMDKVCK